MYGKRVKFNKGGNPYLIENLAFKLGVLDKTTGVGKILTETLEQNGIKCTGNGCTIRPGQGLYKKYKIEKEYDKNGSVAAIIFKGYQVTEQFNQAIRKDIIEELLKETGGRSVLSGMPGTPSNPIEIDHKAGVKNDTRMNDLSQQRKDDFQTLLKNENDAKRQDCVVCKKTLLRPPANKVLPAGAYMGVDYTVGDERLDMSLPYPCEGCVWHDVKDCMEKQRIISKIKN